MKKLSEQAIEEFKKNFYETRGIELSDEEAEQMSWKLLQLAAMTLQDNNFNQ